MIIIFPTETCYGIGCSVFDVESIKKIKELKNRQKAKCMPVVVHDTKQWEIVAKPNKLAKKLAEKYWPGPLTLVTKKDKSVPDELCRETIACRISSNKIVEKMTDKLGPLVATSANFSGGKNPYTLEEIPESIRKSVNMIIQGGQLEGVPSTVYDTINKKILRKGPILPEVG